MKHAFRDLVDIPRLQELTDELYVATGIPSAIITMDGEVLTGSGWQRICTQFHRMHPLIEQECIASDIAIRKGLDAGAPYVMYRCPRGLVDASSPVIIEGEHVANVFAGQLFTDPPDERTEQFFREQARHFDLDEDAYLAAFREVPVYPEAKFRPALSFLAKFARLVASIGLARIRELEAVDELRAAEAKYRIVAENTLDWEFWLSPAGRYAYVSPSCERITGYAAAAFEADPGLSYRIVHHDDRELYLHHVHRAVTEHRAGEVLYRIVRPDGAERWIEHICRPILDADGAFLGTRGSNRDITDRKRTEEALREANRFSEEVIRGVQDGLIVYGTDLRYLVWNLAMERLTGIPASTVLGTHPRDRFPQLDAAGVLTRLERCLAGESPEPLEFPFDLRESGRSGWCMDTSVPLRNAAGEVVGVIGMVRDTTAEHRALEALRERHARLQEVQRMAKLGSWSWVAATDTVTWSEELFRINGLDPARPAPSFAEQHRMYTPESFERLDAAVSRALAEGEPYELDLELVRDDGTHWWGSARGEAVRDATGRIVGLRGTILDITERVRVDAALRLSEEQFRRIFGLSPVPIVLVRPDFRFERCNAAFCRFLGYDEHELQARTFQDVTHPEDREVGLVAIRAILAGDLDVARFEKRYLHRSGAVVWGGLTIRLVRDASGAPIHFLTVVQDLTARREAEEALQRSEARFRGIFNDSPVALFEEDFSAARVRLNELHAAGVTDLRAYLEAHPDELVRMAGLIRILDVSDAAVRTMKAHSRAELLGEVPRPFSATSLESFREELVALDSGSTRYAGEFAVTSAAGQLMWLALTLAVQPGSESSLSRVLVSFVDITERKRLEAEMLGLNTELDRRVAERTAQLEAANREMESFTYSVSHDLRAPLRAIDGYGKAFAEDFGPDLAPGALGFLNNIRSSTRQMSQLVDGLLALSRLGRQRLKVETIETADIVRTALADVGTRERQGLVDVVVGALPACRADGRLLRQAFVNLLQNALKFTAGREAARVEVGCRDDGGDAVFYVRDNGVGFDMQYADKLFQPFQRLHRKEEFPGSGVGLAIVHRIVERHGGRVWAESAPGQGATFFFTIGEAATGE